MAHPLAAFHSYLPLTKLSTWWLISRGQEGPGVGRLNCCHTKQSRRAREGHRQPPASEVTMRRQGALLESPLQLSGVPQTLWARVGIACSDPGLP